MNIYSLSGCRFQSLLSRECAIFRRLISKGEESPSGAYLSHQSQEQG